jgi:hypothetical protein
MGLHFSQDAFRQVCTAALLTRQLERSPLTGGAPNTIVAIGDGHGILAALLHSAFPAAQIWLIDLGPTLLFQASHLGRAFPATTHVIADEGVGTSGASFVYCPAERADSLPSSCVDLAVNVASMQEMVPATVASYFSFLRHRRTRYFYCCNRLEKQLPGGEVVRFHEYPWLPNDIHLIDEPAPWHQFFVGPAHSPHMRIAGIPIPLVHRYDGVHWHRLTRLAPAA